ncbi:anti-repressor SinI family protein [Siminovitchia sp. 179-K 8D1 HS]
MKKSVVTKPEKLDEEWVELILLALSAGIDPQDIRDFFQNKMKNT